MCFTWKWNLKADTLVWFSVLWLKCWRGIEVNYPVWFYGNFAFQHPFGERPLLITFCSQILLCKVLMRYQCTIHTLSKVFKYLNLWEILLVCKKLIFLPRPIKYIKLSPESKDTCRVFLFTVNQFKMIYHEFEKSNVNLFSKKVSLQIHCACDQIHCLDFNWPKLWARALILICVAYLGSYSQGIFYKTTWLSSTLCLKFERVALRILCLLCS